MGELSASHLLIAAVVFVILFRSSKLPGAAKSIGQALRIFKEETGSLRTQNIEQAPHTAPPDVAPADDTRPMGPTPVESDLDRSAVSTRPVHDRL